jgi:hypothetical protein
LYLNVFRHHTHHVYQIFTEKVPFPDQNDGLAMLSNLRGSLPPRPTEPAAQRFLDDQMWDLMLQCWKRIPAERPKITRVLAYLLHINESVEEWEKTLQNSPSEWVFPQNNGLEAMLPNIQGPTQEQAESVSGLPRSDLDGVLEPYILLSRLLISARLQATFSLVAGWSKISIIYDRDHVPDLDDESVPEGEDDSIYSLDSSVSVDTYEGPRRMHAKYPYSYNDEGYLPLTEGMIVEVLEGQHPEYDYIFSSY